MLISFFRAENFPSSGVRSEGNTVFKGTSPLGKHGLTHELGRRSYVFPHLERHDLPSELVRVLVERDLKQLYVIVPYLMKKSYYDSLSIKLL